MDRRKYNLIPFVNKQAIAFAYANKIPKKQRGLKIKYQNEKTYSYDSMPKYKQTYEKSNEQNSRTLLFDKEEQYPNEQINLNQSFNIRQSFLTQKNKVTKSTLSQRMNQFAEFRELPKPKLSMLQQAFMRQTQGYQNQKSLESIGQVIASNSFSLEKDKTFQKRQIDPAQSLLKNLLKPVQKKLQIDLISLSSDSEDQPQNKNSQNIFSKELEQKQRPLNTTIQNIKQDKNLSKYSLDYSQRDLISSIFKERLEKKFKTNQSNSPLKVTRMQIQQKKSEKTPENNNVNNNKQKQSQKPQLNRQQVQVNKQALQAKQKVNDVSKQSKWNAKKLVQCVSKSSGSQIKFAKNVPQESFHQNDEIPLKKADFYVNINLLPAQKPDRNELKPYMQEFQIPDKQVIHRVNSRNFQPIPVPSKFRIGNNNKKYKQQRIDNFVSEARRKSYQDRQQEQIILKNPDNNQPETIETPQTQQTSKLKRSWKYPKLHHPLTIQGQFKQINNNYDEFLQRRMCLRGEPRDLGVLSLDELIVQCYERDIIWQEIYVQYIKRTKKGKDIQFANLFIEGRLDEWNYEELKITLMDHRRLAQFLAKLFPSDFALVYPHALQKEVHEFLTNIYILSNSDYQILLQSIDKTSKLNIWKVINLKYKQKLGVSVKIRPYIPRVAAQRPQIKWRQSCSKDAKYTAAELKAMKNYRFTREKTKINACKENAYCQESFSESSSSSQLSSQRSVYAPVISQPSKNTIKKSSKGKCQKLARRVQ